MEKIPEPEQQTPFFFLQQQQQKRETNCESLWGRAGCHAKRAEATTRKARGQEKVNGKAKREKKL